MENEILVSQTNSSFVKAPEKAHGLVWVVGNICVRGLIVSVPIGAVSIFAAGITLGLLGFDVKALDLFANNKIMNEEEFTNLVDLLLGLIFVFISYIGIKWGCKVVVKKTYIDAKDFGKIGYWVGIIPMVLSFLIGSMVLGTFILGVFLTPRLVKKWLTQFSSDLQ